MRFYDARYVLLVYWDPLRMRARRGRRNEYDRYARLVLGLLARGATSNELEQFLDQAIAEDIGLVRQEGFSATASKMLLELMTMQG